MKKLVSFLTMAIIAISATVCAFAANSPIGPVKPNKLNIVGYVTKGDVAYPSVVISVDGVEKDTTSKNGEFRIDNIESGAHVITFAENSKEIGKISFTIERGTKTEYKLLPDGSYNITVAANVTTIALAFNIENGKATITKIAEGNSSNLGPITADVATTACALILVVSLAGVVFSAYCKKKYSM